MEDLYTVISGTNRTGSNTYKVALQYFELLKTKAVNAQLYSLEGWQWLHKNPEYDRLEKELFVPTTKFIFISPEYNGSIPGVLKLMFDISDYKKTWWGKKALLTGVATGRAGNLRGMEHLTSILHYMKMVVHPNKLPISSIDKLLNGASSIEDSSTLHAINSQLEEFIEF
jgi:chromate reductase